MTSSSENSKSVLMPIIQNWQNKLAGKSLFSIFEFSLFTDAYIIGEIQRNDWPYAFINTVPGSSKTGQALAPVVLRIEDYTSSTEVPDMSKTDVSFYHGGLLQDEIAAVASLCLGVRMKAGGITRRFDDMINNPLGRPGDWYHRPIPIINIASNRLVLPDVVGAHKLEELDRLQRLLELSAPQTISLIRAARLYQDALWIVESEPALAWLMLVSAIETAANQWKADNGTAVDRLKYSRPELVEILIAVGGDSLVDNVAKQIETSLGATKKFIDFSLEHLPTPPAVRPTVAFQISWDKTTMKKIFRTIYKYRSMALHGGTPFPAPMCDPAFQYASDDAFAEKGLIGLATSTTGGIWRAEDAPVNLHTFHYITRKILLNWWENMTRS